MKCLMLYNAATPGQRVIDGLVGQLEAIRPALPAGAYEAIDADTVRGTAIASTYDILARPAIILTQDDGTIVETWTESDRFPALSELTYRLASA